MLFLPLTPWACLNKWKFYVTCSLVSPHGIAMPWSGSSDMLEQSSPGRPQSRTVMATPS